MKKIVVAYIGMLLSSLVLVSFMCCGKASAIYVENITGSWDLSYYDTSTVDSTKVPYTKTTFDTSFLPHSRNSYRLLYNDSVIYTDYTVKPNSIKSGTYTLVDTGYTAVSGYLIVQFPLTNPDTMYFTNQGLQLHFPQSDNSGHVFDHREEVYTRY
jgi:hypothetical protein